eukprot:365220-Rhodomonas_salina.1
MTLKKRTEMIQQVGVLAQPAVPNLLPEELHRRWMGRKDGRVTARHAIESFCHQYCKSCKEIKSNSKTLLVQCPYRTDPNAVKGRWQSKRQIHRPGAAESGDEENNISGD